MKSTKQENVRDIQRPGAPPYLRRGVDRALGGEPAAIDQRGGIARNEDEHFRRVEKRIRLQRKIAQDIVWDVVDEDKDQRQPAKEIETQVALRGRLGQGPAKLPTGCAGWRRRIIAGPNFRSIRRPGGSCVGLSVTETTVIPGPPEGRSPEPMNTSFAGLSRLCSWLPGSRAMPAPRNDDVTVQTGALPPGSRGRREQSVARGRRRATRLRRFIEDFWPVLARPASVATATLASPSLPARPADAEKSCN